MTWLHVPCHDGKRVSSGINGPWLTINGHSYCSKFRFTRNLFIRIACVYIGLALIFFQLVGHAQTPGLEWVRTFPSVGSPNVIIPAGVITDGSGNVYTTGYFYNTRDFNPGSDTHNLTSTGNSDIFVSKLSPSGDFIWAVRIGGTSADVGHSIAIDGAGNVLVTGSFVGTVDFDPGSGITNLAGGGAFTLKLNSGGVFVWAKRTGSGVGNKIVVDAFDDVVTVGSFTGTSDFDPGPAVLNLTSFGSADIFVSKLSSAGNLVWVKQMGGTLFDEGSSVATDPAGNVYTTGEFNGTADFDPGAGSAPRTSAGSGDIFISKLSSAGNFVWANRIGGTAYEQGESITIDPTGNVLTIGNFTGTVDFDPGGGIANLTSAGSTDIFVSKIDATGIFVWAKSIGGNSIERGHDITTDGTGNVYLTGEFDSVTDFDPGSGVFNLTPNMSPAAFVSKLDGGGSFQWAISPRGPGGGYEAVGLSVAVNLSGNILATGWFNNLVDFDPGICDEYFTATSDDIYIWMLNPLIPFSATCAPVITNFLPASGIIGTTVIINGTNFSATASNNIVYFGAALATVTASSKTQLTVTVPAGATYQPISITVNGLTGFSNKPFLVTFPDGGIIDACSFAAPIGFGSGTAAGIALGDLDGDGKTDVVTADYAANLVRVFRNTSTTGTINTSSFAASVDFGVGVNPIEVSIADIDGDGKLDILASNWNGSTISIFRNTSTIGSLTAASFAARLDLATSTAPFNISCQDLDGDGKTDIAVGNAGGGSISIWQNIGSPGSISAGSFNPRLDIAGPSSGFALADVDVDGKADLIAGYNLGSSIGVARNISSPGTLTAGSFAAYVNFAVAAWPEHLAVGDLDSDNRPDIVTSSWPGNKISILKNTSTPGTIGAGSFALSVDIDGNGEPRGVSITDYDGDGLPDIGLSNQTSNVSIYKNANTPGSITSASFLPKVNYSGTGNGRDMANGDIDGDGKPDLVVAVYNNPSLMVLRNTVSSLPLLVPSTISPTSGPIGTTVTIDGTNFSSTPLNNTVKFNGVTAVVTASTPTSITTSVPTGATTGPISIQIGCNTVFSLLPFTVTSGCLPASERNALIALYNATNGAGWTDKANWLNTDESTWFGVTITGCHVTRIDLTNNNLVGPLPTEIGDLAFLSELILSFNQLSGALPASITNLTNLQILKLDNNNTLSGSLPATIGNMTSLQEINTQLNAFTGPIPASLANCTALRNLQLEGNQHTGTIPTFLGSMSNLRSINLGFNQFTGTIPFQLGNLANLNFLSLASNALSGSIPAQIGNLNNLQLLDLSQNQLTGDIPFELGNILYLESLQLWSNNLTGFIPTEFNNLSFLTILNLSQNKLEGFIPEIGFSDVLRELLLADNKFDFIDPVFGTFSELTRIDLSNNRLTSVPVFTASGIMQLAVESNYLDFGSLEPNMGTAGFTYVPQAKIPPGGLINFASGDPLDIFFSTAGSGNTYQWYKDEIVIPGANQSDYSVAIASPVDAGKYYVQITSSIVPGLTLQSMDYLAVTSSCVPGPRLGGTLDNAYDPLVDDPVAFSAVEIQSNGKSIVATPVGTSINGTPYLDGLLRFNTNGSLDGTFVYANYDPGTQQLIVQPDDKILVVGNSGSNTVLKRLNQNGSVDASFNGPSFDNTGFYTSFFGPIALQPDGKVLYSISNTFDFQDNLVRLNSDGSPDGTFNSPASLGAKVIKVQADGKILVAGYFFGGITRLDVSGSNDASFTIGTGSGDDPVIDIAIQTDGKIILIGLFSEFNGETRNGIVRLNTDGSVDTSFFPPGISDIGSTGIIPFKVDLMSNGQILIAGSFETVNGDVRKNLVRLNSDGTLDCTFDPGSSASTIFDFSIQSDDKILIAGDFSSYDGTTRNSFARVNNGASAASCLPASERAALVALFNATNGDAWTNKSNWLSADESTWFGVTVTSCHVAQIALDNNNLTGSLPAVLNDLPGLNNLSLSQNKLTGNIPVSLGDLPSLIYLQLWSNQLTGSIPVELGSISTLRNLNLSDNKLSGSIPSQLGNLSNLQFLEIWGNQLTGAIPSQLGNIPTLEFLRLSSNLLTGSIPTSLGNLSNLFLLDLNQNQLNGSIPSSLGNDTKLKYLVLNSNQLTGSIPIELENLILLEDLILYSNQLSGILPKELTTCTKLKRFGVGDNLLTGSLPKEYGSWTDLEDFGIYDNSFAGAVPVEYLSWTKLIHFYLSDNMLDAIPTFTAGSITEFNVDNNHFEFGDLEPNIPVPGYNYTPQADLPGGTINTNAGSPLTIPFSTSGTANQYQWYKNGVLIPGATASNFSIPSSTMSDAGSYTVNITNTIVTGLTLKSMPFVVTIIPVINVTLQPSDFIACEGDMATFNCSATGTTNITYQWQFSVSGLPTTFSDIINGANYSGVTTSALTINTSGSFGVGRYRCRINGDLAVEVITNHEGLFVNPLPTAPGTVGSSGCSSTSITLTASGAVNGQYRWYTLSTGGTAIAGAVNNTYASPVLISTTTYYVSINNGNCESSRTPVTATVIPLPSSPGVIPGTSCAPSATVVLGASGGVNGQYRWYTVSTGGTPIAGETNSVFTTPLLSASTTFFVSINNGTCESPRTSVLAEIKSCTPTISATSLQTQIGGKPSLDMVPLITTVNNPIDINSIKVVQQPISGATASVTNGILQVDYSNISFAGTDRLTIEACDVASHCAQREITIEVAGEIVVYSGISPNGNGQNDAWIIQYIELLPETKNNTVSVFNRWGDEVFTTTNYDNSGRVFKGLNKNGDELPTGTYFYKIEFASGRKTQTGYLSLKR